MKKLIMLSLILATLAGYSQKTTDKPKDNTVKPKENNASKKKCGLKLTSVYLNPNKYLIQDELFSYNQSGYQEFEMGNMSGGNHKGKGNSMNSSMNSSLNVSQINLGVGFSPYSKKLGDYNKKQEFRLALSYTHGNRNLTDYSETFPFFGETFVSPNSTIYSDTLKTKRISTSEVITELGIDASYIFKTNPDKRVSLFTGIGVNSGYSLTSDLITKTTYSARVVYQIDGEEISSKNDYNISKKDPDRSLGSLDPSILIRPYIPFGINLRLSKTRKFFDKMNLYMQGQIGAEYQQMINGSNYYIKPMMSMGFGVKYNL